MPVALDYHQRKRYPLCPDTVPMAILSEEQAQRVHGQSLDQLARRGGLSPAEIMGNIQRMPLPEILKIPMDNAEAYLRANMLKWRIAEE